MVLEHEFADQAPIPGRARDRAAPPAEAPPEPAPIAAGGLAERVAVLERTILRLQERIARLEGR